MKNVYIIVTSASVHELRYLNSCLRGTKYPSAYLRGAKEAFAPPPPSLVFFLCNTLI